MLLGAIGDEGDFCLQCKWLQFELRSNRRRSRTQIFRTGDPMMKLDTSNRRDWQGFTRILEVMTFLDEIEGRSIGEVREAVDSFCDLPPNPGQTMSMEEVVFWAGVASGIEYSRHADEDTVDPVSAEKL